MSLDTQPETISAPSRRRWVILGLLFLSTVLNYVDRQTLSILARTIQDELGMTDADYAGVVQLFLIAYTLAYLLSGRITDRLGARLSLALFLGWWSLANMATGLARSAGELGAVRFLLGLGEAGNYTAGPKAVSEWFQEKERGLAVGIYTSGAMVGATIAPPLITWLGLAYGWRAAFLITGLAGLLWLVPWLLLYRAKPVPSAPSHGWRGELALWRGVAAERSVWVLVVARLLTDPVWYFYLFWFPKYLMDARGLDMAAVGHSGWTVYLAADLGAVACGYLSGRLIKGGRGAQDSRILVMAAAALVAPVGLLLAGTPTLPLTFLIGGIVAFCHMGWLINLSTLIVDRFSGPRLATIFGLVAAGSGVGGILSQPLIADLVTRYSYEMVFLAMGLMHPLALLLVLTLRRGKAVKDN